MVSPTATMHYWKVVLAFRTPLNVAVNFYTTKTSREAAKHLRAFKTGSDENIAKNNSLHA
jgi:hypothetical protein